jgi:hypothetical protein
MMQDTCVMRVCVCVCVCVWWSGLRGSGSEVVCVHGESIEGLLLFHTITVLVLILMSDSNIT